MFFTSFLSPPPLLSQSPYPLSCHSTLSSPHAGPILCARFSRDTGDYVLTGGQDRTVVLWNPLVGKAIKQYSLQHGREVRDLCLSRTNAKFASGSGDRLAMVWDVTTGEVLRRYRGHTGAVHSVTFNDDESILATASADQTVKLWDTRAFSKDAVQTLRGARDTVTCVRIPRTGGSGGSVGGGGSGAEILTSSMDGCLRRYDIRTASLTTDYLGVPVTSVAWSHDGECCLASCLDSTRKLVDRASGQVLNTYLGAPATEYAMEACFDNTDAYVVAGGEDGAVRVWDLVTAKEVHRYDRLGGAAHTKAVTSIDWHPKKKQFVTASADGTIKLWV